MNHIELFAGCGGLSLGLESEGFELLIANELSPMAGETFAHNHLGLDLATGTAHSFEKVHWISSQYPKVRLADRLSENPFLAVGLDDKFSDVRDLSQPYEALRGSLLVGSIIDLNKLMKNAKLRAAIKSGFGDGEVDLVSGGPPCQSFSMAGTREHSNQRNSLPWAFADFVKSIKPRMVLLENVTGILRPFNVDGRKYYAWYEVSKAFALEGYVPLCLHVNAKYAGAAQNRPRYVMLAFRKDVFKKIRKNCADDRILSALQNSYAFFESVNLANGQIEYGLLTCHDVDGDSTLFSSPLFRPIVQLRGADESLVTAKDAIGDLHGVRSNRSRYVRTINDVAFENTGAYLHQQDDWRRRLRTKESLLNHDLRENSGKVRARFRVYQVLNMMGCDIAKKEVKSFLRARDTTDISQRSLDLLRLNNWFLTIEGERVNGMSSRKMLDLLAALHTKKQTQKALFPDRPAPAALSIPDDVCHYDEAEQRTLTVREMARFQSFPDWFVFRSKVTTGGRMRSYQVPQYTQVGNAVPPLLGKALGSICKNLLAMAD